MKLVQFKQFYYLCNLYNLYICIIHTQFVKFTCLFVYKFTFYLFINLLVYKLIC